LKSQFLDILTQQTLIHTPPHLYNLVHTTIQDDSLLIHDYYFKQAIKGAVHKDTFQAISKLTQSNSIASNCIQNAYRQLKEILYSRWVQRCESFLQWELKNNITQKIKKTTKYTASPMSQNIKDIDFFYKSQFIHLVNTFIPKFIEGDTQIFSILRLNFSASIALAC